MPGRFAVMVPPVASPEKEKSPFAVDISSNSDMSPSSLPGVALHGRSEWSMTRLIWESEPSVKRTNFAPLCPVISLPPSMRNSGRYATRLRGVGEWTVDPPVARRRSVSVFGKSSAASGMR